MEVVAEIDSLVGLNGRLAETSATPDDWEELGSRFAELDRLVSSMVPGAARWGVLRRHLRFAMDGDLRDIIEWDWGTAANVQQSLQSDVPLG